jgi:hypothetical protein
MIMKIGDQVNGPNSRFWRVSYLPRVILMNLKVIAMYIEESSIRIRKQPQKRSLSPEFGYAL